MKQLFLKQFIFLFISLLLTTFNGTAQQYKEKKFFTVYVKEEEYYVTAEVLSEAKTIGHPDVNKEYYWYKSNNILSTKGGYDGKLLHGKYSSSYPNNNLREKGKYKMGLKEGEWIKWYDNGKIAEVSNWKHGAKYGRFQTFNVKQELTQTSHYNNDKLNGEVVTYDSGKVISKKKYKNGVEIIPKEKIVKKKDEKPAVKNPESEKAKQATSPQDSTLNNSPAKKVDGNKKAPDKKKK